LTAKPENGTINATKTRVFGLKEKSTPMKSLTLALLILASVQVHAAQGDEPPGCKGRGGQQQETTKK
jgi:hypothetical protein